MHFNTIIAEFTASGRGAVSGIRLSGSNARQLTEEIFAIKLEKPRFSYYVATEWDNIVLIYYKAPNSYTGEDVVELFCHGNETIVRTFIDLYIQKGVIPASRGEFTKRAYLNGKLDLIEAESVLNIINSNSIEEVKSVKSVLDGELSKLLENLEHKFLQFQTLIEYDIDFNEEEKQSDIVDFQKSIMGLYSSLEQLLSRLKTETSFDKINKIIFIGATNVGKSSIFNSLLGYTRSIVSDTHGTTRDYISEHSFIDDYKVVFTDTAGLRDTKEPIEQEGIMHTNKLMDSKAIKVLVIDNDNYSSLAPHDILVRNKIDLLKDLKKKDGIIYVSAKTGDGIQELADAIKKLIQSNIASLQDTFLVSQRVYYGIENIYKQIKDLILQVENQEPLDIIATSSMNILNEFSKLRGKSIDKDAIINDIFSKFCVGK